MIPVLICLLGGLGAASRFVVDGLIRARWRQQLPVGTIIVNVFGSFLIGILASAQITGAIPASGFAVGATGFCGAFTTFSTAMVETVRLAQAGHYRRALINAFGTLVLTVAAAALGAFLAWQILQ